MNQMHLDDATFRNIQKEMLDYFAEDGYAPVEASVDGLVSIKMDARFQVGSVTIQGGKLEPDEVYRLEQSLVTAINNAIQEVAKRNAERLVESISKSGE